MSKKIKVAGKEYDSRTIVEKPEALKLPNHPKVKAIAVPDLIHGTIKVMVKIVFGKFETAVKELTLQVDSPRRIDAINRVVEVVKSQPMYRRK